MQRYQLLIWLPKHRYRMVKVVTTADKYLLCVRYNACYLKPQNYLEMDALYFSQFVYVYVMELMAYRENFKTRENCTDQCCVIVANYKTGLINKKKMVCFYQTRLVIICIMHYEYATTISPERP